MKKELNDLELSEICGGGKNSSKFEKKFDDMTISEQVNILEDMWTFVGNKDYHPSLTKLENVALVAYLIGRKGYVKAKNGFNWCYERVLGYDEVKSK